MKELIPRDEYGVFAGKDFVAYAISVDVARCFKKQHKSVLRAIENILAPDSGVDEEFGRRNFAPTSYIDQWNRKQKAYAMTKAGFMLVTMGFTGKAAMELKVIFIRRFEGMEAHIKSLHSAREGHPALTEQIRLAHEKPMRYHYSNEADMINRLVTGMSAKEYRLAHGLGKNESIRPHLTAEQIKMVDHLQICDVGLHMAGMDYQERKARLAVEMARVAQEAKEQSA